MSTKWSVTPLVVSVHYEKDNPLYGESATHIKIDDEAGGGYFVLEQSAEGLEPGQIKIDNDELDLIAHEGKKLMAAYDKACERAKECG